MATIDITAATTNKSTEMAKLLADGYHILDPDEISARARIIPFSYVADEAKAAGEYIVFAKVPRRTTIIDGKVYSDGAVATADLDLGLVPISTMSDAAIDGLMDGVDIATAGTYSLDDGVIGTEVTEESYLVGKLVTAGLASADVLNGYLLVVENS